LRVYYKTLIRDGVDFCGLAENALVKEECYDNIVRLAGFNFNPKSNDILIFCEALPESHKNECYQFVKQ